MLVTNWHAFAPESEHKEGEQHLRCGQQGAGDARVFARRVLGDLADRMPILVLNDEGHHCWRPAPDLNSRRLSGDEKADFEAEVQEATVWLEGLDRLNNALGDGRPASRCASIYRQHLSTFRGAAIPKAVHSPGW